MDAYILQRVLSYTNSRRDYANFCLVSCAWYDTLRQMYPKYHIFVNHLEKIVEHFPDAKWHIGHLGDNRNLTPKISRILGDDKFHTRGSSALSNPEFIWKIYDRNSGFTKLVDGTPCDVRIFLLNEFPRCSIIVNPELTFDQIQQYGLLINESDEISVSRNPNITWEIVANNPNIRWVYRYIIKRLGVRWDIIDKSKLNLLDIYYLSRHLPLADIIQHTDIAWDTVHLSQNTNLTIKYIRANPTFGWNWHYVSANPAFTPEDVYCREHTLPWDYRGLSENPNFTWDLLCPKTGGSWDSEYVSRNKSITWYIVKSNPKYRWNFVSLSKHINIDYILANPNYPWSFTAISQREDLKWWHVVNNPGLPWDFQSMSWNKFVI